MPTPARIRPATHRPMRGFTLVELLVVISIIAILIALLVPVLAGVRIGARSARTQTQMQSILTACSQFKAQNQRNPGVFSQEDMGNADNATRGFTNMENVLLDLAGGVVTDPGANAAAFLEVGPFASSGNVLVDLGRIGDSDGPGFLSLSDSDVAPGPPPGIANAQTQQVGAEANVAVPDIVDAFGYPILMWVKNDFAGSNSLFAAIESETGVVNPTRAQYYWNSNAGFLESRSLGKRFDSDNFRKSALSSFNNSDDQRVRSLAGVLGDPASPSPNATPPAPARARGEIVLHSAGVDGLYAENDNGEIDQIVYLPTSGAGGGTFGENDQIAERLNDILIGGGG